MGRDDAGSGATEGDPYFKEYSDFSVHELMLKDTPRTSAYRDAIEENAHLFKGKVVMDVGCGTGWLGVAGILIFVPDGINSVGDYNSPPGWCRRRRRCRRRCRCRRLSPLF